MSRKGDYFQKWPKMLLFWRRNLWVKGSDRRAVSVMIRCRSVLHRHLHCPPGLQHVHFSEGLRGAAVLHPEEAVLAEWPALWGPPLPRHRRLAVLPGQQDRTCRLEEASGRSACFGRKKTDKSATLNVYCCWKMFLTMITPPKLWNNKCKYVFIKSVHLTIDNNYWGKTCTSGVSKLFSGGQIWQMWK